MGNPNHRLVIATMPAGAKNVIEWYNSPNLGLSWLTWKGIPDDQPPVDLTGLRSRLRTFLDGLTAPTAANAVIYGQDLAGEVHQLPDQHLAATVDWLEAELTGSTDPPDAAPTALSATASATIGGRISLVWTNNATNATSNVVERSPTDNLNFTELAVISAALNTYDDDTATAGTWFYRVKARNAIGDSAPSNEDSAITTVPAAATDLEAHIAANICPNSEALDLWTNSNVNITPNQALDLAGGMTLELVSPTGPLPLVYNIYSSTLAPNSVYSFSLEMRTVSGAFDVPLFVTGAGVAGGPAQTVFSLTETLQRYEFSFTTAATPGVVDIGVGDLSAAVWSSGDIYAGRGHLNRGRGLGPYIGPTVNYPIVIPDRIDLSWVDVATDETEYQVERSATGGGAGFSVIASGLAPNTISYTDEDLGAGTWYYRVRAISFAGPSAYSNEDSAAVSAPAAPTTLVATAAYPDVGLTWAGSGIGETAVLVERSVLSGSGFTQIASLPPGTQAYTDVNPGPMVWYYRVINENIIGPSLPSNEDSAMIPGVPATPINLTAEFV